ncbi:MULTISPECIES: GerMN domain-containing protein [Pseudothermotoga]|uniref:GerMN domain-containing protein n=1 Tax=Pseudothermotoga lettingae (strain ATCC BAA-301 / DSM 14385 / NBRC 107922 / TMO) TaxID=416591 RepID=A8F4J7_PSELT|nr:MULTISPECIES: GerMN domain-containing protein [Pseudothermotoga]ABV33081.1 conserved hypothetical protein [Pseudothermotoga lettingae TMO]KUK20796.1 MAG: Uncharacterized protein XD56_1293 [Pseudothermotoga lettingae]GLI47918.1 sporulation protein [Pseudothermotoga lettingae TMO]HBT25647.1 sporulation protein [Pseudothermotoga sp.]
MRNLKFSILMCLVVVTAFCRNFTLFYLNDNLSPVSYTIDYEGDNAVAFLMEKLAQPVKDTISFVPKELLRAYFFVERSLVIDLKSSAIKNLNFDQERYLLHQILRTIFENFKGLDSVYILIDGKRQDKLVNYVDIRYGFSRKIWSSWPVEGGL